MRRFEILEHRSEANGLLRAEVRFLEEDNVEQIPEQYHYMLDLLDHISARAGQQREREPDFASVLYQLIYLLPLEVSLKQRLLEIPACADRAGILHAELIMTAEGVKVLEFNCRFGNPETQTTLPAIAKTPSAKSEKTGESPPPPECESTDCR